MLKRYCAMLLALVLLVIPVLQGCSVSELPQEGPDNTTANTTESTTDTTADPNPDTPLDVGVFDPPEDGDLLYYENFESGTSESNAQTMELLGWEILNIKDGAQSNNTAT